MSWFSLSIFTAISFAFVNILDKFLLLKYVKSVSTAVKILGLFSLLIAIFLLIPQHSISFFYNFYNLIPIAAGFLEIFYIYFYLRAIEKELVAHMVSLFSFSPIFVIAFVFITGGTIQINPLIGILLIILGTVLFIFAKIGRFNLERNKYFFFMIIAAFLFAIHGIFLEAAFAQFSLYNTLLFSRLGVFLGAIVLMIGVKEFNINDLKNNKSYIFILSEIAYLICVWLFIQSLAKGSTAYVIGIINMQPLFVFIISYVLFRFRPKLLEEELIFRYPWLAWASLVIISIGSLLINL